MMLSTLHRYLGASLLLLGFGCNSPAQSHHTDTAGSLPEPILSAHWMGTTLVAKDTNAATLVTIAGHPKSVALKSQTLEKLSQAPWTLRGLSTDTASAKLLQPLLSDILANECRLHVSGDATPPLAWLLACHVDDDRSALWQSNLAAVCQSILGQTPGPLPESRPGWRLDLPHAETAPPSASPKQQLYLSRSQGWTLVGAAPDMDALEAMWTTMLKDDSAKEDRPWLTAQADLSRLCKLLNLPTDLIPSYPQMNVTLSGQDNQMLTEATFQFPSPLGMNLKPWNIPRTLIGQQLSSFTAWRGLESILSNSSAWARLDLQQAPDQTLVWSYGQQPMFTYFAAQTASPEDLVQQIAKHLLRNGQPWQAPDVRAGFKRSKDGLGVEWYGLPYLSPFVTSSTTNDHQHVIGGSFPLSSIEDPIPVSFYEKALSPTNLVYYDWELTGPRLSHWLFMGQFIRFTSHHAQLPFTSTALTWMQAMEGQLEDSVTRVHLSAPDQLTLTRESTLGFTAIELHLLADWLESPKFPKSLNTLAAPES